MAKHNDVYVSHHKIDGWSERKAYIFKAYVNGPKWIPFTTDYGDYLCGYLPPRYPVPSTIGYVDIMPWEVVVWYSDIIDGYGGKMLATNIPDANIID